MWQKLKGRPTDCSARTVARLALETAAGSPAGGDAHADPPIKLHAYAES